MRLPTRLLQRNPRSHKGDFGHIFILAGSARFSGAALLCAEAAMRSGAGLVTLGIPRSLNTAVIKIKPKEVMTLPLPESKEGTLSLAAGKIISDFLRKIDILVIGPGLSQEPATQKLARKIVAKSDKPAIIDADALNALAGNLSLLKKSPAEKILTPHPGEMSRLLGTKIGASDIERKKVAVDFAKKHSVTLILKGYRTVVADCCGNLYINRTGNPGMATAGSGDVLTGIIASFLGQGLSAFDAAKYAVHLSGLAGDLAAKEKTQLGLIASDIIAKIPDAIKKCS